MRIDILAAALLALAACAPPAQTIARDADGRSVKLDLASGRPVVQAEIDGHGPYPVIFDTGAGVTLLLGGLADTLALEVQGTTPLGSAFAGGPAPTADIVMLSSIVVAGIERHDVMAVAIDDVFLPLRGAQGVVGPGTFPDQIVEIDISGGMLWFGPAPRRHVERWSPIGENDTLEAEFVVGGVTIPGHIDTGSRDTTLPASFVPQLHLHGPLKETGGLRTIDTALRTSLGRLDALVTISGAPVRVDTITFADIPLANIGMNALQGFTVVIDYPNKRWALTGESSGPLVAKPALGSFGARAMPEMNGTVTVYGIDPGSRAEACGLRVDDVIVSIDGQSLGVIAPDALREAIAAKGVRLGIVRDGATLELVAQ